MLQTLSTGIILLSLICSSSAFAQSEIIDDGTEVPADKNAAINSRALTDSEINFLNFGELSPSSIYEDLPYPEFSNNIFQAIEGDLSTLTADGTVRLLVTTEPEIDRSAGFAALLANAVSRKDEVTQALAGSSATILHDYEGMPVLLIEVDAQSLALLSAIDAIGAVELDREMILFHTSTIPVIDARDLQLHSTTGAGFEGGAGSWGVAVLDNGLRNTHTAFAGRVASEACFVSDNSCPNGLNTMVGTGASGNCGGAGGRCAHGTHVSGTSVGEFTNSGLLALDGVAPGGDLHSIQVFDAAGSSTYFSDVLRGLEHVNTLVLQGARIASANMSLGSFSTFTGTCDYASPSINTISTTLRQNGVLVIAAAGNGFSTNSMSIPACLSSIVSVGNTMDDDTVSASSNVSTEMDVWAPGTFVTSSVDGSDTALSTYTGTSMSAPHVAGAAAMLRECYYRPGSSAASPYLDDALLFAFKNTGVSVTDQRSGGSITRPRLDIGAAALLIRPNDAFAQAISIGSQTGSYLDLTSCSTREAQEPLHYGNTTGSVWYDYLAPSTGIYTFSTCDNATSFDTVLSVYSGNAIQSLTPRVTNDDACGLQSQVVVSAFAGQSLKVAVSGYGFPGENGSTGVFNLTWSYSPFTCNGLAATIVGTTSADAIQGTNGSDVIVSFSGNDAISGYGGDDTICGGTGNDTIFAGDGNDWIDGGSGNDTVKGQLGNDTVLGNIGDDILRGSRGNDFMDGGEGNDTVDGGWGNDTVKGGPDNDVLLGGLGNDILRGSLGNDSLNGGDGNDWLLGGWGNDYILGGDGNDSLDGSLGDDVLRGNFGDDYLDGGDGNDDLNGGWQVNGDRCVVAADDVAVGCEIVL